MKLSANCCSYWYTMVMQPYQQCHQAEWQAQAGAALQASAGARVPLSINKSKVLHDCISFLFQGNIICGEGIIRHALGKLLLHLCIMVLHRSVIGLSIFSRWCRWL